MTRSVLWFRRDLRLSDHPALAAAAEAGEVLALFVLDPVLLGSGPNRAARLLASVGALVESTNGALVVRRGRPATVVADVARQVGADAVHVTRETTPYGRRRDAEVAAALQPSGIAFVETGTPYAVGPGRVRTASGEPFQVFTPFSRAWRAHGWPAPAPLPRQLEWVTGTPSEPLPPAVTAGPDLGRVGEAAALAQWRAFRDEHLSDYGTTRDRPDLDVTSRLSIRLKYGEIHPRTLLADIGDDPAAPADKSVSRFVTELCWREFYADVLWNSPPSAWRDLRPELSAMVYDDVEEPTVAAAVEAWRAGRTGYPFVDAGMRQLRHEGWMHNRARLVTASFLVKDLHVPWPVGARHFLDHLLDGDLASNNHNWQWTAGTGTDAAPYFRIFNPVTQGVRFDPDGNYVRRWVPELAHLPGSAVHEPWRHPEGYRSGYPQRIVDHDTERPAALARYAAARQGASTG